MWLSLHRDVDVSLDQHVEDRKGEVGHELPDLPSQQHPQDPVRGVNPDPAPTHRHLGSVVANLAQRHGCDGEDQGNSPAATQSTWTEATLPEYTCKTQQITVNPHFLFHLIHASYRKRLYCVIFDSMELLKTQQ